MAPKKSELTNFEKYCFQSNIIGDYLTTAITFIDSEAHLDLDTIKTKSFDALKHLQCRHPFLRAHLERENDSDRIFLVWDDTLDMSGKIQLEFVDLTTKPDGVTRETLLETCAEFNSRKSDYFSQPLLWQAQLISYREGDTKLKHIFNLSMALVITDGLNITYCSVEFLNILNALLTGQVCHEMSEKLEPAESIHYHFEKNKLFKPEHLENIQELLKRKAQFTLDKKFGEGNKRGFYLDLFKLDAATSSRVLAKCKSLGVRVTAFIYTSMFYALKMLYDENGLELPRRLPVQFAINMRMRLNPKIPLAAGRFFVTFADTCTDESVFGGFEDFGKDCGHLQSLVEMSSSQDTGTAYMFIYFADEMYKNSDEDENKDDCDLNLSNLGTFVSDEIDAFPGPVNIKEIYVSDALQTFPRNAVAVQVHVFYWKGELMLQFGANKAVFGSNYSKRFVELLKDVIKREIG